MPYFVNGAIDLELDHLSEGIIQNVPSSQWAAPIVAVPKKDGKVRILWQL